MSRPHVMEFDALPPMWRGYLGALRGGASTLPEGTEVPQIEAVVPDVRVSAGKVASYNAICGFAPGPTLPPTLPQVLAAPLHLAILNHDAFPLRAMGLVHLTNRIEQHAPVATGDVMTLRAWTDGSERTPWGGLVRIQTEVLVSGERRLLATMGVLAREPRKGGANTSGGSGDGGRSATRSTTSVPAAQEVGESSAWTGSEMVTAPEALGRRYASISGDYNPIHLAAPTARLLGFKRHIAHGMWTLARGLANVIDELPAEELVIETTFRKPVFLPARLRLLSRVVGEGDARRAELAVRSRDGRKLHVEATLGSGLGDT